MATNATSQTLRIPSPSLSLSSKLPLSSVFSVSLPPHRRTARPLTIVVYAGLDAKPTVLVAEKLGEAGLNLLKDFANVDCSYNLTPEELCTKISLCDALIVRSGTKVTREVFESSAGRLKVVGRAGVGIDNVDLAAATEHGCLVVNAPTANTVAAAEHGIALLAAMARNVAQADASVKADDGGSDTLQSGLAEQGVEVESHEITGTSQGLESTVSENDSTKVAKPTIQSVSSISFSEAQRFISLFFALCTKKPSLLQIVFNVYEQAPRTVKQAFHRHIPNLVRALGQSYSELLHIISDPPQGSENLLTLVLQVLTQDSTPSSELISTVKRLYETKFRDVTILVPLLSSLSKKEVLPIFPRLVDLPLDKFQRALAHILQGSAHTGPALTPVEVLVAIHGITPEKDGLALKKITDACSACFEQRTVFTQQVLAKALNQMVDQTPLPLLFMRTVIQAIDAFPALVDFVMEILSKLVRKQVWRMPKLWVGFLKCVYQTQPRSFHVLLQLPPQQLESALNRHANLRGPLASYANQPTVKSSLTRSTLAVLGLANETHPQQHLSPSLHPSETSSSVSGATLI